MASPQQQQPKGTILVTGGGGYVGGHVVLAALKKGYNVRVTARSEAAAQRTLARYPSFAAQLSSAVVRDITDAAEYGDAFADGSITAIAHAASPFVLTPADNERDLLRPAIRGATAVLEAAARFGSGEVRAFVATSSFAAVVDPHQGLRPGYTYTEADWNPVGYDEARTTADGVTAYVSSKALAERAMWTWMEEHPTAGFTLTTLCSPWVFGAYAWELDGTAGLSPSVALLDGMIDADVLPAFDYGGFADAAELGLAHVRALEIPEAAGRRFIVGCDFRYQYAVDAAREAIPELRARLPVGTPGCVEDAYAIDGSEAERVLGITYGSLRDTIVGTYRMLLRARELEGAR
ncbi:NAD(P)-binding protein [Xylariaceae sp. FL0662B]|nr:NAD(P)-binding protein [Xylariaceae sp. FL0662B]